MNNEEPRLQTSDIQTAYQNFTSSSFISEHRYPTLQ